MPARPRPEVVDVVEVHRDDTQWCPRSDQRALGDGGNSLAFLAQIDGGAAENDPVRVFAHWRTTDGDHACSMNFVGAVEPSARIDQMSLSPAWLLRGSP